MRTDTSREASTVALVRRLKYNRSLANEAR
jgi:hypothetical protein